MLFLSGAAGSNRTTLNPLSVARSSKSSNPSSIEAEAYHHTSTVYQLTRRHQRCTAVCTQALSAHATWHASQPMLLPHSRARPTHRVNSVLRQMRRTFRIQVSGTRHRSQVSSFTLISLVLSRTHHEASGGHSYSWTTTHASSSCTPSVARATSPKSCANLSLTSIERSDSNQMHPFAESSAITATMRASSSLPSFERC